MEVGGEERLVAFVIPLSFFSFCSACSKYCNHVYTSPMPYAYHDSRIQLVNVCRTPGCLRNVWLDSNDSRQNPT